MNNKLNEIIEKYKGEGHKDVEVQKFVNELLKASTKEFYLELLNKLTDEDFAEIDGCRDQKEANELVKKLYQKRTGKHADIYMQEFLPSFAEKFYEEDTKRKITL